MSGGGRRGSRSTGRRLAGRSRRKGPRFLMQRLLQGPCPDLLVEHICSRLEVPSDDAVGGCTVRRPDPPAENDFEFIRDGVELAKAASRTFGLAGVQRLW